MDLAGKKRPLCTDLTSVSPFVNFKIFRSGKYFATAGERTGKGLFSGVYSDMIYKFVFGFEWFPFSGAVLPEADVVGLLGSPHMLHRQMGH